ncbi:MAG TPA: nitrite reductase [Planctomycetaceae bacterium]|nr:nitrite reductase [Planctomycetaceae bacterium]
MNDPFITVAQVGDIREGAGRTFSVGDHQVAIFRAGDRYFALDDFCPHMGASLGAGTLRGEIVVCCEHHWAFKLADGTCLDAPTLKVQTFPVRVVGETIQVALPAPRRDGVPDDCR